MFPHDYSFAITVRILTLAAYRSGAMLAVNVNNENDVTCDATQRNFSRTQDILVDWLDYFVNSTCVKNILNV